MRPRVSSTSGTVGRSTRLVSRPDATQQSQSSGVRPSSIGLINAFSCICGGKSRFFQMGTAPTAAWLVLAKRNGNGNNSGLRRSGRDWFGSGATACVCGKTGASGGTKRGGFGGAGIGNRGVDHGGGCSRHRSARACRGGCRRGCGRFGVCGRDDQSAPARTPRRRRFRAGLRDQRDGSCTGHPSTVGSAQARRSAWLRGAVFKRCRCPGVFVPCVHRRRQGRGRRPSSIAGCRACAADPGQRRGTVPDPHSPRRRTDGPGGIGGSHCRFCASVP